MPPKGIFVVFGRPPKHAVRRPYPPFAPTPQGSNRLADLGCDFVFIKPVGKN
jgi:hypothetical protein